MNSYKKPLIESLLYFGRVPSVLRSSFIWQKASENPGRRLEIVLLLETEHTILLFCCWYLGVTEILLTKKRFLTMAIFALPLTRRVEGAGVASSNSVKKVLVTMRISGT